MTNIKWSSGRLLDIIKINFINIICAFLTLSEIAIFYYPLKIFNNMYMLCA